MGKEYIKEKGKNLATKEDIEEITKKIEKVKLELEYFHSQKIKYQEENKLALMNFYDEYIHWCEYSLNNVRVTINHLHYPESIQSLIVDLNLKLSNVQRLFWRTCLFEYQNQKFVKELTEIFGETEYLHNINRDYLEEMESLSINLKVNFNGNFTNLIKEDYEKINKAYEVRINKISDQVQESPNKLLNTIRNRFVELYN